jgi:DinB family protein
MTKKTDVSIALLLEALDEAFDHRSWHGTNLRGSIRGLTAQQAAWRPGPGRHNIWEIVAHAAYWKYAVRRLIAGAPRGSFPLRGSNWFARPEGDAGQWRRDLDLLADEHRQLRAAVAALPSSLLKRRSPKKRYTYAELIRGIAAHDLYHAGQIQLLKRLRG